MKSFATSALAFAAAANGQSLFESIMSSAESTLEKISDAVAPLTHKLSKNKFGCLVEESIFEHPYVEKTIKAPLVPYHMDYAQQEAHLKNLNQHGKKLKSGSVPIYTCANRAPLTADTDLTTPTDFGMFLPVFAAHVDSSSPSGSYAGSCFETISFEYSAVSETSFEVTVTTENPASLMCKDTILFANTEIKHFEIFAFEGTHKLTFEMNTPEVQADVGYGGIKAYAFCDDIVEEFESLFNSLKAFIGGLGTNPYLPVIGSHVPPYMEKANIEFLSEQAGINMELRETQVVDINPDLI